MIKITCLREGFRRNGIAHPAETIEYPDGRWSTEEIRRFKEDPMFFVEERPGEKVTEPESPEQDSKEKSAEKPEKKKSK